MIVNQYGTYKEHGHRHTRLYNIWSGIKARCNRRNNPDYKLYGKRGIRVCDEWNDFGTFYAWAISNGYGETLTIDRIDGVMFIISYFAAKAVKAHLITLCACAVSVITQRHTERKRRSTERCSSCM